MQIVVKKKVLEEMIDQVVREVSSFHSVRIDEIPAKIDEEDKIVPAEEMSTQLSQQKPKVDDPAYKPVNTSELSKAAAVVAEKVPQSKVQQFYKQLKDLAQNTQGKADAEEKEEESMISEKKMQSILSFLLDRPVNIKEARGKRANPNIDRSDLDMVGAMIKDADAGLVAFMDKLEKHDRTQHPNTSRARMAPLTMAGVYALLDGIARKRDIEFRRQAELDPVKAELLAPGGLVVSPDRRTLTLKAMGVTQVERGLAVAQHNLTQAELQAAAEQAVNDYFDELAEYYTTGHLMGDPDSGIKREKQGTLRTEAGDIAQEIFIQLGNQLPMGSKIPEATLRSFAAEASDFVKNTLSPENTSFSFTFTDLIVAKPKKGKKGAEEVESETEDDDDDNATSSTQQVAIDFSSVMADIGNLPAQAGVYSRGFGTAIGQKQISRVDTAAFFKESIGDAIIEAAEGLLDKYIKVRKTKFKPGEEGRNLASDILRRMGGSRSDIPAETVHQYLGDIKQDAEAAGASPEEIERQQFDALFATDVLSRERFEMRTQLYNTFLEEFLGPAIFLAAKGFEDSPRVSKEFQRAAKKPLEQIGDKDPIFNLYTDVLKMFGSSAKLRVSKFFRTYEAVLQEPEFRQFVEKRAGATGLSDLSRASTAFFDKDITLVFIVNMAADYLKKTMRSTTANSLISRDVDGDFRIALAFGKFLEKDIIDGIKDGDAEPLKLLKKVESMIEDSGMGFVKKQPEKKKKDAPISEVAILRGIIRRSLR
jgi:flagellar motor protein MotB